MLNLLSKTLYNLAPSFVTNFISYSCLLLSQLAQASITKLHQCGGLRNRHVFISSQFWRLESPSSGVVRDWLVVGTSKPPGFQTATFSLCSHKLERERQRNLFSYKAIVLSDQVSTLTRSFNLSCLLKILSPDSHTGD